MSNFKNAITDVTGISVGHCQDLDALTGCSVIICEGGAIGGVDQRGGGPATRETDALRPMHLVGKVHAILLTGGSAFGLNAAAGVMRFLEEKGVGFNTGVAKVPIVAAAALFDLAFGRADIRPDAEMGYKACLAASSENIEQGNVGAGTGATIGKILGPTRAMKSGLGTASMDIGGGVVVGAMVAVNAFGDVIDPSTGEILAGARPLQAGPIKIGAKEKFADTLQIMKSFTGRTILGFADSQNTVIGVVATNAQLNSEETNKVAQMAHNGYARTIRPAHTMYDGDTIFSMATGKKKADVNIVGAFAAEVMAQAVINAIKFAAAAGGLPAFADH